ncbi:hypothetical protein LCGC14_1438700 [marine sediment metagenome]|uniref:Uncharacterized protein n=1 Tax=marine sediment metagenome TaxID=412755 RepID=A0A0F9M1V1_9ZZZZ
MNKRPVCAAWVVGTTEKCTKPAIYYIQWDDGQSAVCGLCARRYLASALHPLRLKDWKPDKGT